MKIETNGIVIKEVELCSGGRLFKILTEHSGIVTAVIGNSYLRKNSKFSSIHVFTHCRFVMFEKKDYYHIDEIEVLDIFWGLKDDLRALAVCQYFCELCIALSPENTVSKDFLRLFLNSMFYISKKIKNIELIKIIFEIKAMSLCGYMPDLVCCSKCRKYESNTMLFMVNSGKIFCETCFSKSNDMYLVQVTKGMIYALRHVIYSPIEKIFSFEISDNALKVLSNLSEKYVKYHLDTSFKSLEFYSKL